MSKAKAKKPPRIRQHTGQLTFLGNSLVGNGKTTYSVVELGDEVLKHLQIPRGLDNYLHRGLDSSGDVTLHIVGASIVGVTLPDGKTYISDEDLTQIRTVALTIFGAITLQIVFGVFFLWAARVHYQLVKEKQAMRDKGAIVV